MAKKPKSRLNDVDQIQLSPVNLGQEVIGKLPPVYRARTINVLTYSATIAVDPTLGDIQQITVTDTTNFTLSNPKNPGSDTMAITFEIKNSSGGAMGTITWDTQYKLAGAFTNPASTKTRTIRFYFNGTNWIEECRAAADIS